MPSRSELWPPKQNAERFALVLCAALAVACGDARHRIGNAPGGLEDLDGDGETEALVGLCAWDADIELIDDLQDGDYALNARGRVGTWFAFNDKTVTGTQEPHPTATLFPMARLEPARAGHSTVGVHTRGSGFGFWGGGVGLDLDQKRPYDATPYAGIAFFARSATGILRLRAEVTDRYTSPLGGECVELPPDVAPAAGQFPCFANNGAEVTLTPEWQAFVIEWAEMEPMSVTARRALKRDELYGIQFQTMAPTTSFDFYVDDVTFLCPRRAVVAGTPSSR